jgi:tRNA (guanine-N7-)-methyltransferase
VTAASARDRRVREQPAVSDREAPPDFRTFRPRRRQLTQARAELFDRLAPIWCVDEHGEPIDGKAMFGRTAPVVLEIGIGLGESFTTMAAAEPSVDVIGADVHTPGIASSLARIESLGLQNARLVHGDALVFMRRLGPASLVGLRIFFPDPWPKVRHRHRRIVSEANLDRFVSLLSPGGTLHVATDIDEYVRQVQRTCSGRADLVGGVIDRPDWRPATRYETKGLAAGRMSTDLMYRRV